MKSLSDLGNKERTLISQKIAASQKLDRKKAFKKKKTDLKKQSTDPV